MPNNAVLTGVLLAISAAAFAQVQQVAPFGIRNGQPLSELDREREVASGTYALKAVPKPNPLLTYYAVQAYPPTGVCEIIAASAIQSHDDYGVDTRNIADSLASSLRQRYGTPKKVDVCNRSQCRPQFWMMHIQNHTRDYAYIWHSDQLAGTGLSGLLVQANALSISDGIVYLRYAFDNKAACDAARATRNSQGL